MSSGLLTPVALFTSSAGTLTWTVNAWQGMGLHLLQNKALQSTTVQAIPLWSCAQGACLRQLSQRRVMQPTGQQVLCTDPLAVPLTVGGTYIISVETAWHFHAGGAAVDAPAGQAQQPGRAAGRAQAALPGAAPLPAPAAAPVAAVRFAGQQGDDFREVDFDALLGEQQLVCVPAVCSVTSGLAM